MTYVENMLKLEGGIFGELVRSTMLSGVVDLLIDLDVRKLKVLMSKLVNEYLDGALFMKILHILAGGDRMG